MGRAGCETWPSSLPGPPSVIPIKNAAGHMQTIPMHVKLKDKTPKEDNTAAVNKSLIIVQVKAISSAQKYYITAPPSRPSHVISQ